MRPQKSHDVFVSYSRADGRDFASRLRQEFLNEGFSIWQDVISLSPGNQWWSQIKEAIENVGTMVLIVTSGALQSTAVRDEWVHARQKNTQILPVVFDGSLFSQLPRWMRKVDILNLQKDNPDYSENWSRLVEHIREPEPVPPVPFMPHEHRLKSTFVQRKELYRTIIDRLIGPNGDPIHSRVALLGPGGFGKTTLSIALCYDPDIVETYCDGILWATIGEDGKDILSKLTAMANALTGKGQTFKTVEEASRALHIALERRECLMVLDDVWETEHIKWLLSDDDQTTRLISTRSPEVVSDSRSTPIDILAMEETEAVQILTDWLPDNARPKSEQSEEYQGLLALARRLGFWPLLLDLAAKDLRYEVNRGHTLQSAIDWCVEGLTEEDLTAFDAQDPVDRNRALNSSMMASLRRYDPYERQRLYELSIFEAGEAIPDAVATQLWMERSNDLSQHAAKRLLRRFAGHFYQMRVEDVAELENIRFHDSIREYLSYQLDLETRRECNISLLCSYNPEGRPWYEIPDDGYLYDHIIFHLHAAGEDAEIRALFDDDNWLHNRFYQSGYTYTGYIDDLLTAWTSIAHNQVFAQIEAGQPPTSIVQCVRYALLRSSINSLSENYPPSLISKALETGLIAKQQAFSIAARVPSSVSKQLTQIKMYTEILNSPKLQKEEEEMARILMLEVVLAIDDEGTRAHALSTVTNQLEGDLLQRGVKAALAIHDSQARASALTTLANQLEGDSRLEIVERGLKATLAIHNERARARALSALAEQLEDALIERGLEATLAIHNERARARALSALAKQLEDALLERGLEAALNIHNVEARARALNALASQLEGDSRRQTLERALEAVLAIRNKWDRAQALGTLADQLEGDLLGRGLEAALAINNKRAQVQALSALANRLEGESRRQTLERGLEAALALHNDGARARALSALANQLEGGLLERGLEAALTIRDEGERVRALSALANQLEGGLLERGLEAALTIHDEVARARALSALASQLEGGLLERGLEAALALQEKRARVKALNTLASQLDGESRRQILERALEAALAIHDERARVQALSALANRLKGESRKQTLERALEAALAIHDEWTRARALSALASQLEGDQLERSLESALVIRNEGARAQALSTLASQLKGNQLERSLEAALAIHDEWARARILRALANQLEGDTLERALEAALAIHDEGARARTLSALASQLEGDLLERSLEAALAIHDEEDRALALRALSSQLEGESRQQTLERSLEAALAIPSEWLRARTLNALANKLDVDQLERGREAALAIRDARARVQALSALANQLEGDLLECGLDTALTIIDEEDRASALGTLVSQLDGDLLERGLEAALDIHDERARARVLNALANQLEDDMLERGLEAALAIHDARARAHALMALLPAANYPGHIIASIQLAVADHLLALENQNRVAVLKALTDRFFAPPIFSKEILEQLVEHISEICWEWDWR